MWKRAIHRWRKCFVWWDKPEQGHLYLSCRGLRAVLPGRAHGQVFGAAVDAHDGWSPALQDALAVLSRGQIDWHVWLSGGLCQLAREAPVSGLSAQADIEAYLSNPPEGVAKQQWVRGAAVAGEPWLVARLLLDEAALRRVLAAFKGRLVSLRPWWCAPTARTFQAAHEGLAFCDEDGVTHWRCSPTQGLVDAGTWMWPDGERARRELMTRLQWAQPLQVAWLRPLDDALDEAGPVWSQVDEPELPT